MIDEYKSNCLKDGTYAELCELKRIAFSFYQGNVDQATYDTVLNDFLEHHSQEEINATNKIWESTRKRSKRLRSKFEKFARLGFVYFVTLTFRDDVFENTSAETRRKYVSRTLSSKDIYYVANVDYGEKNGREHYHAVICTKEPISDKYIKIGKLFYLKSDFLSDWENKYGFVCIQGPVISKDNNDNLKIAKYLSKVSNHALKETAVRETMLYNRKLPTWRAIIGKPIKPTEKWLTIDDNYDLPFD